MDAKKIAREIEGYIQDAAGDMASGMISFPSMMDDKWRKKYNQAKKAGCRDLQGYIADEIYNDPDDIQDLIGDRICDLTNGNEEVFQEVCRIISKDGHSALSKAASNLLKEHSNV